MAEALVKFFLQRVDLLLSQEDQILSGQKDQILLLASLLNEILRLKEENRGESAAAADFPNCREHKLRDIAYRFDDCLDEFIIQRYSTGGAHQSSLTSEFESKLQKIETQLDGILEEEKRIAYGVIGGEKSSSSNPSCSSLLFYIRYCFLYCCRSREYALVPNEEVDNEEEKSSSCFMSNYINLPYYLRYCLLYCCIFPEKYWLRKGKLIRLLVAEGLIEEREGKTEEEIAEEYIEKLVNVGMLRVRDDCQSRENRLKVADQYRQICLQMIEEEHFANRCSDSPMPLDVRRVVISEKAETILLNLTNLPVRSLLMVGINSLSDSVPNCLRSFVCGVKLLRVLDLEGVKIRTLPDEVGDLIHLRYLCLKNSDLTELPESLSNLKNLQTLDIRWCGMLASLPNGTSNLLHLRHLKMYKNVQVQGVGGVVVPPEIGLLQDLQTITGINAGGVINQEFSKFSKLKRLGIKDVALDHSRELYSCIKNIPGLRSLSLEANSPYPEKPHLHLDEFSPPPILQKLCLEGSFDKLPESFLSMKNVIKMRLGFSHLTENPASVLQFLPNLKELSLWQAYDAKHIGREFCDPGGFPKLEDLTIASHVLEEWSELVEGAMPSLKSLKFHNCLRLNLLPDGLQLLTTLQELVLLPLLDEHKLRLRPNGGSENYKIKHIPKVTFMTTSMVQLHVNPRQNSCTDVMH